jgi:putative ABC transport system substrate-binding protein
VQKMKCVPQLFLILIFLYSVPAYSDVAVIKTAGITAYDDVRNGFSSVCFENKREFNLQEDLTNQNQINDELKAGTFSLILGIGSQAATFAKTNFPDIPLVFCLVVDPEKNGFKADKITGVSYVVPIKEQFSIFKSLSKKIKRIGVIYTQPFNDSLMEQAKSVANDLSLQLVTSPIQSGQDIQKAMTDIDGKADALWIPPDPSLFSEEVIRYIGTTSISKQLPFAGPNELCVRAGAIFSLAPDSIEAGREAGEMANKIVQGTPPSGVPIQELKKLRIILNLKAAGLLGLEIPQNILKSASKIYQ